MHLWKQCSWQIVSLTVLLDMNELLTVKETLCFSPQFRWCQHQVVSSLHGTDFLLWHQIWPRGNKLCDYLDNTMQPAVCFLNYYLLCQLKQYNNSRAHLLSVQQPIRCNTWWENLILLRRLLRSITLFLLESHYPQHLAK